jgi:hypothetical protein
MVSSTSESSLATSLCNLSARVALLLAMLACSHRSVSAQTPAPRPTRDEAAIVSVAKFVGGAAVGLVLHESGHLVFDVAFDAGAGTKKVSYAGIPFLAVTHHPVSPVREFAISSAGFWVQHATSELLLTRRPNLRQDHAPLLKGVLAFNVLASVVYTGAAFARTGPLERDTRGMALSARVDEPWIGGVILVPAALDAVRYFRPESRALRWASRVAKIGGVLLVIKAAS